MTATYARMVSAFVMVAILSLPLPHRAWWAMAIFVFAAMTDYLDGYWARRFQCESAMGKFMDPIADKLLVLCALIMLLSLGRVDSLMVILLLSRDIFIGGLRSVAAANAVIIAAKPFGKWKTALQMVCIPCLFLYKNFGGLPLREIGYYGLWVSVALSLLSGGQYTYDYYRHQKASHAKN